MHTEDNMDFDRQIRSILQDAEEPVPQGVWDAVCADLDRKATKSSVWRYAGIALAAAAVAAGIFLIPDKSPKQVLPESTQDSSAEVIVVPDDPQDEINPDFNATAQVSVRNTGAAVISDAARAREAERENILSQESITPAEIIREDTPQTDDSAVQKETEVPIQSKPEVLISDDWLDDDIPQAGRRVSLTVNGAVTGNDKDFSSIFGPQQTAPSISFQNRNEIKESGPSNFSIPFSAGLGLRVAIGRKFSVGSGLNYSYLARTFSGIYYDESGKSSGAVQIGHYMQYLGIPVNIYYDMVSGKRLKFYVYMSGQADFCLSNKYQVYSSQSVTLDQKVSSVQWSAGLGLGVEFLLVDKLGIYFDPGARYYFPCGQPKNIHTERPFNVNFDIGFRYDF